MSRPFLALAALLGLAGCSTGTADSEDQATCLTYGGPLGSSGYTRCLALRDAQERDQMLNERADGLSH